MKSGDPFILFVCLVGSGVLAFVVLVVAVGNG